MTKQNSPTATGGLTPSHFPMASVVEAGTAPQAAMAGLMTKQLTQPGVEAWRQPRSKVVVDLFWMCLCH